MKYLVFVYLLLIFVITLGACGLSQPVGSYLPSAGPKPPQVLRPMTPPPTGKALEPTISPQPSPTREVIVGPYVSQQSPDFRLNTLDGHPAALQDNRGKVILLNFWASWCVPCKEEMPLIQAAYGQYQERGLVVWGINMTHLDQRSAIKAFLQETGVTFPILMDEDGAVSEAYRIISIPTTFFVDRDGVIRHFQLGPITSKQLNDYLEEMLK